MTALKDSTVLITGAASGLGRLMAIQCAAKGAHLVLWDRDAAGLRDTHAMLPPAPRVHLETVDLTGRLAIQNAYARTLAAGFEVDVLVNNAGVVSGKPFLDTLDADIERSFAVNALAPIRITRAFLPGMLARRRGHVVTVASAAGLVGTARLVDYCASKHAAVGFDEALRLELERLDAPVRTTIVCPYFIDTGMFEGVKTRFSWLLPIMKPEPVVRRIVKAIERDEQRLILPWFVYSAFLVKVLPVPVFDWLLDFFGISRSMDEFKGRGTG